MAASVRVFDALLPQPAKNPLTQLILNMRLRNEPMVPHRYGEIETIVSPAEDYRWPLLLGGAWQVLHVLSTTWPSYPDSIRTKSPVHMDFSTKI